MSSAIAEPAFQHVALRHRLGTPTNEFGNARGKLVVWSLPERGLLVSAGAGHGAVEFVEPFLATVDDAIALGVREIWDDWANITSYDSASRTLITKWTVARPLMASNIHVLIGSKLVAMGVNLSNLALGRPLRVTSDRTRFERDVMIRLGLPVLLSQNER